MKLSDIKERVKGFTPGPWSASNCAVRGPITPAGRESTLAICECVHPQGVKMDVARINAQLIASAPDLLALAEELEMENAKLRESRRGWILAINQQLAKLRADWNKELRRAEAAEIEVARLRAELAKRDEQFGPIVKAARSWHDFHHGSDFIQCDEICKALPLAEKALAGALGKG